ncbi:MAG: hypothetical protein JSW48_01065 [Betaproteobacteria bacterium]|nr:MAG: hypothetical protein JSW48_01065 [Betaproteobacteria bacterium]
MSADNKVNSDDDPTTLGPADKPPERPRWWLRNPAAGVLSAAMLGVAALSVTASIKTPDPAPGSTLLYIVILPIALLLPAIAVGAAFVAWRALGAAHGGLRLALAPAAALALILNLTAVGLFIRWMGRAFLG